ncbi:MAG: OmpH family outer membrane protein [Bryobacteraceae bacterium]
MKCVPLTMAVVALGFVAPSAPAQSPNKVGIINMQGAMLATKDGEKARDAIRAKFEPKAKDLEGRMSEMNRLQDQFNKGANTMSAEAREKLSRDIDDKKKKYQWDSEDLQNEVSQEEQKLVNEIGQRMVAIVDEYSKANTLAIVFDVSGQQSPVLWAANGIDITTQIVELYDKKYGVGGAPVSTLPAAKPAATTAGGTKPAAASTGAVKPGTAAPAAAPKK